MSVPTHCSCAVCALQRLLVVIGFLYVVIITAMALGNGLAWVLIKLWPGGPQSFLWGAP